MIVEKRDIKSKIVVAADQYGLLTDCHDRLRCNGRRAGGNCFRLIPARYTRHVRQGDILVRQTVFGLINLATSVCGGETDFPPARRAMRGDAREKASWRTESIRRSASISSTRTRGFPPPRPLKIAEPLRQDSGTEPEERRRARRRRGRVRREAAAGAGGRGVVRDLITLRTEEPR